MHVPFGKIENIQYEQDEVLIKKFWGRTLYNVWWACDMNRLFSIPEGSSKRLLSITVKGEKLKKGFSCEKGDVAFDTISANIKYVLSNYNCTFIMCGCTNVSFVYRSSSNDVQHHQGGHQQCLEV